MPLPLPDLQPSQDYWDSAQPPELIAGHPCALGWKLLRAEGFASVAEEDRAAVAAQVHGLALSTAVLREQALAVPALIDSHGHFHLHGLRAFLDFGLKGAGRTVPLAFDGKTLSAGRGKASRDALLAGCASEAPPQARLAAGVTLRWNRAVTLTLECAPCHPILNLPLRRPGPHEHRLARLSAAGLDRFTAVLREALVVLHSVDPEYARAVSSRIRAVVPLHRPDPKKHVSSTYSSLPGAIFLCHDEDPLLQAETLIHEARHDELNALDAAEPMFAGPQPEARYLSPWRPDPRPLRGILLGAHAFLAVGRLLVEASGGSPRESDLKAQGLMRALQVRHALATVRAHARLSRAGEALVKELESDLARLFALLPAPPGGIWGAASHQVEAHLAAHAGAAPGLHKEAA